jgi:hypothetical protein
MPASRAHKERDKKLEQAETSGRRIESREPEGSLGRKGFNGAETAGYLVYHTVIAAWLFVTVLGVASSSDPLVPRQDLCALSR